MHGPAMSSSKLFRPCRIRRILFLSPSTNLNEIGFPKMTLAFPEMPPIKVPDRLPDLVKFAFNRARRSKDVNFYNTQVALLTVNSLPFQLRFSPALANKPRAPLPPPPLDSSATATHPLPPAQNKYFNPFESPADAMLITTVEPSHNLVLNKFAIVPEHFILTTKTFKPQTDLLEEDDLAAAHACVEAYHNCTFEADGGGEKRKEKKELFVFFNSGPHSGASQPHRHLQLLPVERMKDGLSSETDVAVATLIAEMEIKNTETTTETKVETSSPTEPSAAEIQWEVLANGLLDGATRRKLPFQTFARRISPDSGPASNSSQLRAIYLDLYRKACAATLGPDASAEIKTQTDGKATISYNLAMTREVMVLVPRLAEGGPVVVSQSGNGKEEEQLVGQLALNGTVLAGTALVKTQAEWDALRRDPGQLVRILGRIGVPQPSPQVSARSRSLSPRASSVL